MAVDSMPRVTNSNSFDEFGESMKPRAAPAINQTNKKKILSSISWSLRAIQRD
jgi:hypothetical protein